jgi:NitT/TauT family transport system substrate-binding protein
MVNSEFIPTKPDLNAAIDSQLYAKVLAQLARENPNDPFWKKLQKEYKQKDA